jgi:hypothetical protein
MIDNQRINSYNIYDIIHKFCDSEEVLTRSGLAVFIFKEVEVFEQVYQSGYSGTDTTE